MTDDTYSTGGDATELADLAFPYALDALDADERAEIDGRIAAAEALVQAEFEASLRAARETLALTSSVTAVAPPPALRARILDAIAENDRQNGSVTSLAEHRTRRASRWRVVASAAAAVVIVGVGGVVVSTQLSDSPSETPTSQVLAAGDVRASTVEVAGGGTATVNWSRSADAAVVTLADLAPPGSGREWQLWLIDGSAAPRSVGLVEPNATGTPQLVSNLGQASTFAVSVEPAGGSPAPTTTPIAAVTLDA